MAYSIFLSHSFKDQGIVAEIQSHFQQSEIRLYVAEIDRQYGKVLPAKIKKAIDDSDAVLAIVTKQANESPSVNQEVGYAIGKEKLIVPVIEEGAKVGVLLQGLEFVEFSLTRIQDVFTDVGKYFGRLAAKKEEQSKSRKVKDALVFLGIALGAVALVGLIIYEVAKSKK